MHFFQRRRREILTGVVVQKQQPSKFNFYRILAISNWAYCKTYLDIDTHKQNELKITNLGNSHPPKNLGHEGRIPRPPAFGANGLSYEASASETVQKADTTLPSSDGTE